MGSECFLAKEWEFRRVSDVQAKIPRAIISGPFGSNVGRRFFVQEGIPLIRGNNLTTGAEKFIDDGFVFLSEQKANELNSWAVEEDIIFTAAGTLGQVGIIPKNSRFKRYVISNKQLRLRLDKEIMLPMFAYYWFSSPKMVKYIQQLNTGSTVPLINLEILKNLPIPVPPMSDQQAIACILGALDDKIELNRKMNRTLEEIAQAVFKSWFVDFDPVRYKAAGQDPPGLAPHIADLFPDSFEDSELGEIPKGWQVRPIGELVRVVGGGTPSTREPAFWGGEHAFCTPKDMSSLQSMVLLDTERRLTDLGLSKVSSGELPPGTVLLSSRAPIGYLAITEIPVTINQGIIAMICDQVLPNVFVLFWLQSNMDRIIAKANGSTFLEISKQNFRSILTFEPNKTILDKFKHAVEPIYKQIVAGEKQSRTLAALRDTLLPKLVSGEIRVPDAERIVGRCI